MHRIPSWLRDALKRFIKYLAVPLVSIPAGIAYLVLLRIIPQPLALAVTLPLGLLMVYFAWAKLEFLTRVLGFFGDWSKKENNILDPRRWTRVPMDGSHSWDLEHYARRV